jgi:signal transduction histidine kinase
MVAPHQPELSLRAATFADPVEFPSKPTNVWLPVRSMANASMRAIRELRRPRKAMLATVLVGTAAIVVDLAHSSDRSAYVQPSLYVAVETTAALAGFAAAYLLFFRFRRNARFDTLLIAVGLAILSVSNLLYGAVPVAIGHSSNALTAWGLASGHVLGALVLVLAAFVPRRRVERPRHSVWLVSGYAFVALGMLAEAMTGLSRLLPIDVGDANADEAALIVQFLLIALFGAASIAYLHRAEEDHDPFMTWLAIAAALRVFSGIDYALSPSLETGRLYIGDIFRMGFYFALLAAAAGEVTRYWQASREAAVLDERQRIARDLHDGLAQELAFIVRRAKRTLDKGSDAAGIAHIANAAERALDESRRVIAALTRPLDEPLDVVLSEAVKGIADRVGTTVALSLEPEVHVAPDVREALVRIAREAVTNAARHGDARLVRVELENGNGVTLRIVDDGRGFDTFSTRRRRNGGFGFTSMADRTRAIGGVLSIESVKGVGTTVEVVVQ